MSIPDECAELLDRQRGVMARWQATAAAIDPVSIDTLLRGDRWQHLYRGTYAAFTGRVAGEALLWAAVLRCGPGALLSHETAAGLDKITDRRAGPIHVTVAHDRRIRFVAGEFAGDLPPIVVHRTIHIAEIRHPSRLPPRTRIADTVLDLASQARDPDAMYGWLSMAVSRRLVTPAQLRAAADRRPRLRLRAEIMEALEDLVSGAMSSLERRHLRDVERAHGLPPAQRQVRMRPGNNVAYLDNLYAAFLVIVELDGITWHQGEQRRRDIRRDNRFFTKGLVTLRYDWSDVTVRPCEVAAEIGEMMRRRGWTGTLRACGPSCQAVSP